MTSRLHWRALYLLGGLLYIVTLLSSAENVPASDVPASDAPSEKGVTFSHVYKIEAPGTSSCKVDSLASEDQSQGVVTTVDGENVVFSHNIRLRMPQCDCGESEDFKSLMYRVNGLEEEVNYLKTQCSQGCCSSGGVDTSCSGHGTYSQEACSCQCDAGWEGPDCSVSACPDDCNDNGRCVDGKCVCHQGFTGDDCNELLCPNNCNDKGHCVDGRCVCFSHFTGEDCGVQRCLNDCVGNGRCVDGQCVCEEGFFGDDCSLVLGPKGLQLVRVTEVSLLVEWEAVRGAEYYVLTHQPKGDDSALQEVRVSNAENSYLITDLTPGVTYIVDVYAVIKQVKSESDSIEATTETIDDIMVVGQTEDSIQVDWRNPAAAVDHFRLTHIDPAGQEEEQDIQMSQEARTRHTIMGLNPGTEYQITVQAIKGNIEGKPSSVTGVTDIDAPTNLVTLEVTEDTAHVTWDRIQAEIDSYVLSYSSAEGSSGEIPVGPDSSSYRLVGLRPGVLYTVYIWAVKGDRVSRKSSTQAETELDAPTNLSTREETESTFLVSWDRVEADIEGYMLSYSSAEGSSDEISVGPDSSSYRLAGLKPGVRYTVYVRAVRGDKSSRTISTQGETELDAPTNLLAREETESSFLVSWDRVQADIQGYVLSYSSAEGSSEEISVGADSSSYRLTGLRPGVRYTVYIWAVRGNKASRKTSTQGETELDAPTNLSTREETESSFLVSWDRVQADIEGYVLSYSSAEGPSKEISVGPDSSSYRLVGLRPGVRYTVHIWAVRGNKASTKTSTQGETELDAPTNLLVREKTESTLLVWWEQVQADIEGYMLSYRSAEGSREEISVGPDSSSYRLVGLRPGVLYTVSIWAVRGEKASKKTSTRGMTELDAPTNLSVREETESTFLVSWDRVQADIEGYMLSYGSAEGSREEISVGPDSSSYRLVGLRPGVLYTVSIWAVRGRKASKKTSTEGETELDAPTNLLAREETEATFLVSWDRVQADIEGYMLSYCTALLRAPLRRSLWGLTAPHTGLTNRYELDAPTNLSAREETEATFLVSWDRVQADIEGYMLSYSSAEGSIKEISVGPDSSSYRLVGLGPGIPYTVYIWAVRQDKASRMISAQGETELDAPTNLLAREETESTLLVSWDRVQADIDGYMLSYGSADDSTEEASVGPDSSSYRLVGLRPGVLYTVNIWAVRGNKASRKTSTQGETELDAPTNLLASEETESTFLVLWDRVQADIEGYMLSYSSAEGSIEAISLGPDSSSYRLNGLRPGVLYTVYIWAVRRDKASRMASTQGETELDAPTNLLAREETESTFLVSWDRVQADIEGYMLSYSSAEGSSEEISVGPDSSSYRLVGLRPGVLYTVYIWAVRGNKASKKTSTKGETEIDAPRDLKATDVTLDSAVMSWVAPLADIDGYTLTYRSEDGTMETVEKQLGAGESRFALSGLEMSKRYLVTIIAYRGARRSKVVETVFKTVGLLYPFPMDCVQIMKNGNKKSGIYTVYINNDRSKPIEVFCDMDMDGGGWLVFQRRNSGRLDFMKRWRQYIAGFGNMTDEFWLGMDKIYELTNTPTQYELRVELGLGSERAYAIYDNFKIAPAKQKFKLTIGNYRGNAGDAMIYHQGRPWSTVDSDNDIALGNCALTHRGAWWYKNCHLANLNGKWGDERHSMGVNWEPWKGHLTSLDFTEMKIRPLGALSSRKKRSLMAKERNRTTASKDKK